jgi:hypothetical protein
MRNNKMTLLVLLVLGFGAFLVVSQYVIAKPSPTEGPKQKWEYCRVFGSYHKGDNQYTAQVVFPSTPAGRVDEIESSFGGLAALNKLGAEGWEIVGIIPIQSAPEGYILKRPKS